MEEEEGFSALMEDQTSDNLNNAEKSLGQIIIIEWKNIPLLRNTKLAMENSPEQYPEDSE